MTAPRLPSAPDIYRAALRRVAFGQIVLDEHSRPRHHSDVLVPHVQRALVTLHQHEFIAAEAHLATMSLRPAVLTLTGTQLLDWLNRLQAPEELARSTW